MRIVEEFKCISWVGLQIEVPDRIMSELSLGRLIWLVVIHQQQISPSGNFRRNAALDLCAYFFRENVSLIHDF
jgi:hypothetical protein